MRVKILLRVKKLKFEYFKIVSQISKHMKLCCLKMKLSYLPIHERKSLEKGITKKANLKKVVKEVQYFSFININFGTNTLSILVRNKMHL